MASSSFIICKFTEFCVIYANVNSWRNPYYPEVVKRLKAERQFAADLEVLQADTCVLILPCGRSSHTEA